MSLLEARVWQVLDQHEGRGNDGGLFSWLKRMWFWYSWNTGLYSAHWCIGLRSLAAVSLGQWKATVSHGGLSHSPSPKQKHNRLHCYGEFNPLVLGLARTRIPWALLSYLPRDLNTVQFSVNLNTQPGSAPATNLSFSSLSGSDMSEMSEE